MLLAVYTPAFGCKGEKSSPAGIQITVLALALLCKPVEKLLRTLLPGSSRHGFTVVDQCFRCPLEIVLKPADGHLMDGSSGFDLLWMLEEMGVPGLVSLLLLIAQAGGSSASVKNSPVSISVFRSPAAITADGRRSKCSSRCSRSWSLLARSF